MHKLVLVSVISLFAMAAPFGAAGHGCNGAITDIGGVAYVDDRDGTPWIYAESNGEAGLQSGGSSDVFGWADECTHANPDTLVY